ncbi:hypothetical protein RHGRI_021325 [Rhododendron griersonianum]|uniref:Uncharacterized protein n=1 Tax=Rhododendron griersonianum TaxID=479676 RepID=A0AAV6JPB4_9ERIC|nr:hypothetical protein RHGRI_021325 [Rhododendron griersonianum]
MKSFIFAVGEVINIEELAADLGCKVGCLPSFYLGFPLGAKYRLKAIWDPLGCKVGCLPSFYLGFPLAAKYRLKAIWDPVVERFERRGIARVCESIRASLQDFVFAKEVRLGTYSTRASSSPPPAAIVAAKAMRTDPRAEPQFVGIVEVETGPWKVGCSAHHWHALSFMRGGKSRRNYRLFLPSQQRQVYIQDVWLSGSEFTMVSLCTVS